MEDFPDPCRKALIERITADRARAVSQYLEAERTAPLLCELMEESHELLDDMQAEMNLSPPLACAPGCGYCCFNQVSLTPPEALYLGFYVLERLSPEQTAEVSARMDTILALIRGKNRREIGMIRHLLPCPFLLKGLCAVHPARPLVCRGWNSVNAAQCRKSVEERSPLTMIESHALLRELADAVQLGLLQGASGLGLEAGYLVITRAGRLLLDHGVAECAAAWLDGRPFFAGKQDW